MRAQHGRSTPESRRLRKSTTRITEQDDDSLVEYTEEREQEEVIYSHERSYTDQTAAIDFMGDDRPNSSRTVNYTTKNTTESTETQEYTDRQWTNQAHPPNVKATNSSRPRAQLRNMSVDYSPNDFEESRARIDAASRQGNVRVKKVGDTTIVTEHRDPYSFYWQLDQFKKREPDPPRKPPPTDYIIEEEEVVQSSVVSPQSHDSGLGQAYIERESQYSRPFKEEHRKLPAGWEKHEDPSGFSYYWHVDSGTIQREAPRVSSRPDLPPQPTPPRTPSPPIYAAEPRRPAYAPPPLAQAPTLPQPAPPSPLPAPVSPAQPVIEEHAFKQVTTKRTVENHDESEDFIDADLGDRQASRFMVRSMGRLQIPESDLTTSRSSKAVNDAIRELTTSNHRGFKFGEGKELIMELNDHELALLDPETSALVHAEPIQLIRVWGVGQDNGRDFAYVSKDRQTGKFMCHVFRCDTPARAIANTLRDICRQLVENKSERPLSRLTEKSERRVVMTEVPRATGIDILNDAVDRLVGQVRPEKWLLVDVAIALSSITITEVEGEEIAQCRVRYLSFLGVGRDVKHCAFIVHTSSQNFLCYVFHVEPSAAVMAKTIEGACKLRYQKVLDSYVTRTGPVFNH